MDNEILEDIKNYAVKKLNQAYGFCGVATSPEMAMLNSTDKGGKDIKINIRVVPE